MIEGDRWGYRWPGHGACRRRGGRHVRTAAGGVFVRRRRRSRRRGRRRHARGPGDGQGRDRAARRPRGLRERDLRRRRPLAVQAGHRGQRVRRRPRRHGGQRRRVDRGRAPRGGGEPEHRLLLRLPHDQPGPRRQQRPRAAGEPGDRHRPQPDGTPHRRVPGVRPRVPPGHAHRRRRARARREPSRDRLRRRPRRLQGLRRQRERGSRLRAHRPLAGRQHPHRADPPGGRRRAAAARPAGGRPHPRLDGERARRRGRGRVVRERAPVRGDRPGGLRRHLHGVPLDRAAARAASSAGPATATGSPGA